MFGLKEGLNDYNYDMCGMVSYTISNKNIRYRRYSIHDYLYLYSRTSVFVFVFEAIRIRIRIRLKIWKQIWFHWYPSVFDPITPLLELLVVGGIYSPNHQSGRWGRLLSKGAPDTVRCASHVTQPLGFDRWSFWHVGHQTVRWCTGQLMFTVRCAIWRLLWLLRA